MKDKELEALRKKLREKSGSKDPLEFRPPKVTADESREYKMYILPALSKGDTITGGKKAPASMEQFFYEQGAHWMDNRRHECPRVHDGEKCPLCEFAFDLMRGVESKKERSEIAKAYLPRQYWAVNVYFLDSKSNPEELRGKILWWSAPKTIFEMMEKCILNDDPGDDPDYPKPYGAFFDTDSGHVFSLKVRRKGEYNNYEQSGFIGKRRPLAKEQERVDAILAQRVYLPSKFNARDLANIQRIVDDIEGNKSGGGFDDDDEKKKEKPKEEAKKEEKPKDEPKKETPKEEPKEESKEEVSAALDMSKDPEVEKLLNEFADDDL